MDQARVNEALERWVSSAVRSRIAANISGCTNREELIQRLCLWVGGKSSDVHVLAIADHIFTDTPAPPAPKTTAPAPPTPKTTVGPVVRIMNCILHRSRVGVLDPLSKSGSAYGYESLQNTIT